MRKIIAFIPVLLFALSSCSGLFDDHTEFKLSDNAKLYGTEWSTHDKKEGVKFNKDDSVLFFSEGYRGTGTFEYSATSEYISFEGGDLYFPKWTCIHDCAFILEDGTMKLCWHVLGETE